VVWHGDDVFERSSLLFIGRAGPYAEQNNRQGYEVILVLKGQTQQPGSHVVEFGRARDDCKSVEREGAIASVATTDRSPLPSVCDGSGNLLGKRGELARMFELAGAQPATLSGAAIAALLEPKLKTGRGAAWFVGPGPAGETLEVAGRQVHVVDAIDGIPAGDVFRAGRVLKLQDVVFVELLGATINEADAMLQVPSGGSPRLFFAFWKGGVIRIPEP